MEMTFFKILKGVQNPLIRIHHSYSEIQKDFVEKLNKYSYEFREDFYRKGYLPSEIKNYFDKANKLIDLFASSAESVLPF